MAASAPKPLSERPAFLLSQVGFHSAELFAAGLAPLGLQPRHFGLLTQLAGADGLSQQQLADLMAIHRNAMVGLLDDLEERGLVERRRHPRDRRAHAVHLTPAARRLLAQATAVADTHDETILAPLDPAERVELVRLLGRVAEHAGLAPGVHPGLRHH
ncbi:MAG: winged helix-turn-helix transcriptional regulator [Candidatus Dormibacteraeota bacterium]|nr:winged helix-turn-helix transcriptional regulator [Candidatus Dormibacteraeota bacterium]MBO0759910.1 winged helix-turn-helix transcriptional regulator [Candidatus Dormibacteraeota bacterium]